MPDGKRREESCKSARLLHVPLAAGSLGDVEVTCDQEDGWDAPRPPLSASQTEEHARRC